MSEQEQTTAVAVRRESLPVRTMEEIAKAGALLAQSGMFGITNDGAGFVVLATCQQQGISLMDFIRTYHIINGKPSMKADAMLAEFRKRGGRYTIVENTQGRAAAGFEFEGNKYAFEITIEDAKRTGDCMASKEKMKDIWIKRADDMLWARLISRAVRRLCPEINSGLYAPEEVQDFDDVQKPAPGTPLPAEEIEKRSLRAKTVKAEAEPPKQETAAAAPEIHDATTCPMGDADTIGKQWTEFDNETLQAALEFDGPAMTAGHKAAIRLVLDERKGSAK